MFVAIQGGASLTHQPLQTVLQTSGAAFRISNMADDGEDWGAGHQIMSVIPSGNDQLYDEPVESTDVKSEPASPDEDLSRTHFDSQDEENDVFVAKEQRRFAHSAAEQKRRDAIRKGYDDLQTIVPTCHQPNSSTAMQKLSKAIILQKSIEYIMFLHQQKKKQEEELEALRKEVMALKIMKTNYEQIAKAHQNQPAQGKKQVPDQAKFSVFRQIMETQFLSFNASVTVTNFEALSACIFSWLEEYCKPQYLQEIVINALKNLNNQGLLQQ